MIRAGIAVGVGCLALFCMVLMHRTDRVANSAADADAIGREIRITLPIGSPLSAVEEVLSKRGIEFGFDESSKAIHAIVRKVKGSGIVVSKSLELQFYFDDASQLKSFQTKVVYAGP
jgi:hypothetical protein